MIEPPKHPMVLDTDGVERLVTQDDVNRLVHIASEFQKMMQAFDNAKAIKNAVSSVVAQTKRTTLTLAK